MALCLADYLWSRHGTLRQLMRRLSRRPKPLDATPSDDDNCQIVYHSLSCSYWICGTGDCRNGSVGVLLATLLTLNHCHLTWQCLDQLEKLTFGESSKTSTIRESDYFRLASNTKRHYHGDLSGVSEYSVVEERASKNIIRDT